jgi:O-antigen/teichoic acid export membrane protein
VDAALIPISDKLQLVISSCLAQALRIGTGLVMARLVSRDDYGLYTLILALPGLISLNDLGISASWIKMQDRSDTTRDTAVLLGVGLYALYGILLIGGGGYLAITHRDYRLWLVGAIVAVTGILQVLYTLQLADLNQQLHFRAESKQNILYAAFQAAAGIGMAAAGLGIFALAMQGLAAQVVANAVISRRSRLRLPRSFSLAVARRFVSLGGKVGLAAYVANLQDSTIALTINRMAGQGPVGDWGRATQIQALFAQNVFVSFERMAYPLLCRATADPVRLRDLITKATLSLLLIAGFTTAWLLSMREDFVVLGLGGQWLQVPPLLAIMALAVPAGALYSISYNACYALGRTSVLLRSSVINTLFFLPALLLVCRVGVEAIAWAWVGSQVLLALLNFGWIVWAARPPLDRIVKHGALLVGAGSLAGGVMAWVRSDLSAQLPILLRLTLCSVVGLLVYGLLVRLTQPQVVFFVWRTSRGIKSPEEARPPGTDGSQGPAVAASLAPPATFHCETSKNLQTTP